MRKIIISLIGFLIFILLGIYVFRKQAVLLKDKHCLITQISSRLMDLNTFEIKAYNGLKKEDFTIVNINSGMEIYKDGVFFKGMKNEHGYCLFDLYYKKEKLLKFGHFKTNNWITNDYLLHLYLKNGLIEPKLELVEKNRPLKNQFYRKYSEPIEEKDLSSNESFKYLDFSDLNMRLLQESKDLTAEKVMRLFYPHDVQNQEGNQKIILEEKELVNGNVEVLLIHNNLLDDSLNDFKYIMELQQEAGAWQVVSLKQNWKCKKERGHTNWGIVLCR